MATPNPESPTRSRWGWKGFMIFLAVLYIAEGLGQPSGLLSQPTSFLLVKLNWSPLQIADYLSLVMAPWYFKPIFGLMSDNYPLFGYRRKSYLLISNLVALAGFWWIGFTTSPFQMGIALFLTACGMAMTTTVSGALLVELGKDSGRNNIFTSQQWLWFSIAAMGTAYYGGHLTEHFKNEPWTTVHIASLMISIGPVLCVLASIGFIQEVKVERVPLNLWSRVRQLYGKSAAYFNGIAASLRSIVAEMPSRAASKKLLLLMRDIAKDAWLTAAWLFWWLFKDKDVLGLCLFIFLYNYSPGFGTPLYIYQTKVLGLDQGFLGDLGTIGAFGSIIGAVLFMFSTRFVSLRSIIIGTILVGAVLQASAIIYTSPWIFDMSPWLAHLGLKDAAWYLSLISGVVAMAGQLAGFTLMADASPKGAEGYTYALLASVFNLTNTASSISGAWIYENSRIAGDLQTLILVSAVVTLVALPFVFWWKLGKKKTDPQS